METPPLHFHYDLICPRFSRLSLENTFSSVKGTINFGLLLWGIMKLKPSLIDYSGDRFWREKGKMIIPSAITAS